MVYNKYDLEAIRILDDFLPDRIFDRHMHISTYPFDGVERFDIDDYVRDRSSEDSKNGKHNGKIRDGKRL